MSILVKGMRMPKNCIGCPMQFGGMCYVQPADIDDARVAATVEEAVERGRPSWCPLQELVHCCECKEAVGETIDMWGCKAVVCGWDGNTYTDDWFCAAGARKEQSDANRE